MSDNQENNKHEQQLVPGPTHWLEPSQPIYTLS